MHIFLFIFLSLLIVETLIILRPQGLFVMYCRVFSFLFAELSNFALRIDFYTIGTVVGRAGSWFQRPKLVHFRLGVPTARVTFPAVPRLRRSLGSNGQTSSIIVFSLPEANSHSRDALLYRSLGWLRRLVLSFHHDLHEACEAVCLT